MASDGDKTLLSVPGSSSSGSSTPLAFRGSPAPSPAASPLVLYSGEKQAAALKSLRALVDELFSETAKPGKWGKIPASSKPWCDDACLSRFLRANKWKVDAAFGQLYETLGWRRDFKLNELTPKTIEKQLRVGKMYTNGRDKAGRPIIYTKKRVENTEQIDFELQTRQLVYTMEKAIRLMNADMETWVWIIDLNGYSRANSAPMDVSKRLLHILSTCYPERLFKCFLVDAPMIFQGLWAIIKPFLDPVTKAKVVWVDGPATDGSKKQKAFLEWIDADQLEVGYGGKLEYTYDYEKEDGCYDSIDSIPWVAGPPGQAL